MHHMCLQGSLELWDRLYADKAPEPGAAVAGEANAVAPDTAFSAAAFAAASAAASAAAQAQGTP